VRLLRSDGGRPCGPEDLGLGFYTLQGWLKGVNSERLQPGNDIGHDGDLADGSLDNDLIGRDAFGFALGYYGDDDFDAIANAWTSTPGERAFTPIGVDVPANTLATNHAPLFNGNIAHTVYTLQPFGTGWAGWDGSNTEGQVLAQVYTYDQLNRLKKARGVAGMTNANTWIGVTDGAPNRYRSEYEYDANGNIVTVQRYDADQNYYDAFSYKYEKRNGRVHRNRLYELYDDADASNIYVNEVEGAQDIGYMPTVTNTLDPAYFNEEDPDINENYNYHYDALGNLIHDGREQIQAIQWTVAGKVKSVSRTTGSTRKPLTFAYGASGQRILKNVSDPDLDVTGSREHYIRDAQGNIMATYRYTNPGSASLQLNDRPLYGSARLGTLGEEMELHSLLNWDPADPVVVDAVALNYELTDHLGNVCTVVTGRLLDGNGGGTLKQAELVSAQGYEPFGALLPGRKYETQRARPVIFLPAVLTASQSVTMTIGGGAPITLVSYTPGWTLTQYLSAICTALGTNGITAVSYPAQNQVRIDNWPSNAVLTTGLPIAEIRWDSYRFGFQGQEKDNEIYGGEGSMLAFEYRMHDPRVGRFWSIDPLAAKYPWNSPYAFAENKVIQYVELEGLETGSKEISGQSKPVSEGEIQHRVNEITPLGTPITGQPLWGQRPTGVNFTREEEREVLRRTWENAAVNQQLTKELFEAWTAAMATFGSLLDMVAMKFAGGLSGVPTVEPPPAPVKPVIQKPTVVTTTPPPVPPVKSTTPAPALNFKAPTNPPQVPIVAPKGYTVRVMQPTEQYPTGYWRLEKPMPQGGAQGIDPRTMKPGPQWDTHVPLPSGYFD
jgi:RHS repeat-associated protein